MPHRAQVWALVAALTITHAATATTPTASTAAPPAATGCFAAGDGFLRARMRGALALDLDWKNEQMQCEGGPRPSGNGLRVSIGGPVRSDGRRILMVFGIAGIGEGHDGDGLRTNVTILFEGEKRIFSTQGDDKCTVDKLTQQRVETLGKDRAIYRVVARGFCLGPATSLSREERLFLTSFDFAGRVEFGDDDRHANTTAKP